MECSYTCHVAIKPTSLKYLFQKQEIIVQLVFNKFFFLFYIFAVLRGKIKISVQYILQAYQ